MQALLENERDARAILFDESIQTKFKLGAIRLDVARAACLFLRVNIPVAAWDMIAAEVNYGMSIYDKHGAAGGIFPPYKRIHKEYAPCAIPIRDSTYQNS